MAWCMKIDSGREIYLHLSVISVRKAAKYESYGTQWMEEYYYMWTIIIIIGHCPQKLLCIQINDGNFAEHSSYELSRQQIEMRTMRRKTRMRCGCSQIHSPFCVCVGGCQKLGGKEGRSVGRDVYVNS